MRGFLDRKTYRQKAGAERLVGARFFAPAPDGRQAGKDRRTGGQEGLRGGAFQWGRPENRRLRGGALAAKLAKIAKVAKIGKVAKVAGVGGGVILRCS